MSQLDKQQFDELCKKIRDNIQSKGTKAYSRSDHVAITHGLLNTPDYVQKTVIKNGDIVNEVETKPVTEFREELANFAIGCFGVDKNEAEKAYKYPLSKRFAEAFNNVSGLAIKKNLEVGRKYTFPVTSKGESKMSIAMVDVDSKTIDSKKIVKDEKTGAYASLPTGKKVTTKPHAALKASNKIPFYLKESK